MSLALIRLEPPRPGRNGRVTDDNVRGWLGARLEVKTETIPFDH